MVSLADGYTLHHARGLDAIPTRVFHGLAQLRQQVFIVEQDCVYLDLDGRDTEPNTTLYWVTADGAEGTASEVVATIRVLDERSKEPGLHAIGRVATATYHRGKSLAAALLAAAIADFGDGPLVLHAQSHLTEWYARFGFTPSGPEYLEDGIPHTPMRRG